MTLHQKNKSKDKGQKTARNSRGLKNMYFLQQRPNQKWKFSYNLLTPVPIESLVKFCGPQNISAASSDKKWFLGIIY